MSRVSKEGHQFREFPSVFAALDYMRTYPMGAVYHSDLPSEDSFLVLSGGDVLYYAAERSSMASEVVEVLTDRDINDLFFSHPDGGWYYRTRSSFSELIGGVGFFDTIQSFGRERIAL